MIDKTKSNERTWAIFAHLSALLGLIGIPFANLLAPFVIWLIKKKDMPLVDTNGKEALNLQISMTIYCLVAGVLCLIVIGIPILISLVITNVILVIIASVKISNGESYQYPLTIRFIK